MSTYQVLFSGDVVQGANPDQVRSNLARELGISEQKVRQLFSGRTVVIGSALSEREAESLVSRLGDLGAICRSKNNAPKADSPNPARYKLDEKGIDKTLRDLTAAHVECPRCSNLQLIADHCTRCGIDIEAALKQKRKEDLIIEKKLRELRAGQQKQESAAAEPSPITAMRPAPVAPQEPRGISGWFRRRRKA